MKKVLQSVLSAILLVNLGGCGTKNTEAPDSVIERHAMEYYRTREYEKLEGYQGSEVTVLGHDVNEKDHTDAVVTKVSQSFAYGHFEHMIEFFFEYDRSSDLWDTTDANCKTTVKLDKEKFIGEYEGSANLNSYTKRIVSLSIIDLNDTNVVVEGQVTAMTSYDLVNYHSGETKDISGTYPIELIDYPSPQFYKASLPALIQLNFSAVNGLSYKDNGWTGELNKLNTPADFDFDSPEAAEEQTGIFSTNTNFIGNEKMIRYWIENGHVMMFDGVYQNLYEEGPGAIGHLTVKSGCIQEIYDKTSASAQKIGEVYDLTPLAYYETVQKNGYSWYKIDKDKSFWINDANQGIDLN